MHELAITQNLVKVVLDEAKAAGANKVTRINLIVGELSGAVSDCVQFYFDILKKDSAALQETAIDFKHVQSKLRCRDCQTEFHPQDAPWVCTSCGSYSIEIVEGRDCFIESIEVEP